MITWRLLLVTLVISVPENGAKDLYFITTPNELLSEATHNFNVYVSTNAAFIIETIHPFSHIKNSTDVIILERGYKSIQYVVPFVGRHLGQSLQLKFRGDKCSAIKECLGFTKIEGTFINETRRLNLLLDNFVILSETDKPIYKPGDTVKLRAMALYPTNLMLTPESRGPLMEITLNNGKYYTSTSSRRRIFNFDRISIENPDNIKMVQWLNVTRDSAMRLAFSLSQDPMFGQWTVTTVLGSQIDRTHFQVKKYVLPRFAVEIYPPKVILQSDKDIRFKVCASYSTGKNMQALISGRLCITTHKIICLAFQSYINGTNKCKEITVDGSAFGLGGKEKVLHSSPCSVTVKVTENSTSHEVTKTGEGSTIRYTAYEIKWLSKNYFKPGLPYFGQLKLQKHDGSPQKGTKIVVNVDSNIDDWGFEQNYTSNEAGMIEFVIPNIPFQTRLSLNVNGEEEKASSVMVPPSLYQTLSQWGSGDKEYIQISPLVGDIKCPDTIRLNVLMNGDVSSSTLYIQIVSRGLINKMIEFPPVPVKCLSRDDHLGHYECATNSQLKCLKGWKGGNCREPVCEDGCNMGACISLNNCVCRSGWSGRSCSKCVIATHCVHGYCKYGNDCLCRQGWTGYRCDTKGPVIHSYKNEASPFDPMQGLKQEPALQNQTIFERYIDISLEKNMGPDLHIVVFYINNGNEVVADSLEINKGLTNCSHLGGGEFQFDKKEANPREMVKLFLDPGTKNKDCSLKISDIALSQFGQSSNFNLDFLILKLTKLNHRMMKDTERVSDGRTCFSVNDGQWQSSFSYHVEYDSRKIFVESGLLSITNARVVNIKCREFTPIVRRRYTHLGSNQNIFYSRANMYPVQETYFNNVEEKEAIVEKIEEVKSQIREFFPESWIFDFYNASPSQFNLTVPDSMTTWVANAFCMTEKGFWIAPSLYLTVILPFFTDIYVPYSIKMDEIIQLPVKLFNYVNDCYEIKTDMRVNASEITISGPTSFTICVCPNDIQTINFNIKAIIIGKLNITVTATSMYSSFCSSSSKKGKNVNYSDSIRRQLLVEPSGIQKETTFSTLICNNKDKLGLKGPHSIPSTIVPGSLRSYLVYNGDVMGQTFDNLDRLVNMPYGCGEQNMVALVPSIYVLDYLTNLQIKNPDLIKRAKGYILDGYQRQLAYKHPDGSYSAFGKSDKSGNTWLTAFVLKSFSDASKFVSIDNSTLKESVIYLEKMQSSNGCFKELGQLLSSSMAGGLKNKGKTDEGLLTAYVLIALKNIKTSKRAFNISKALACVKSGIQASSPSYHLSLSGYALSIHEPLANFTQSLLEKLKNSSISSGRYKYWKSGLDNSGLYGQINSADVETTAYALLALNNFQTLSESLSTIYWLSNQRNSLGGYYSTQDTIVALKAIAVYAEKIGSTAFDRIKLEVDLDEDIQYKSVITDSDRLVTRKINMGSRNISYISIKSNGTGCLSLQLVSLYNIEKLYSAKEEFEIRVKTELTDRMVCTNMEVKVCSSYLRKDRNSNMILITVDFPSGWEMKDVEKNDLLKQLVSPLKRIDFLANKMHLYYDSFLYSDDVNERCLAFRLDQATKVDNLKSSFVRMVDYYKPEVYIDTSYVVPTNSCKITNTTKPKPSLLCPVCFNDTDESVFELQSRICPWSFTGLVSAKNNSLKDRIFYESKQTMFLEWTVDLQPTNCTCLRSWSQIYKDFVVVSSEWLWPDENLTLTNTSALFSKNLLYRAYRSDLGNSCYSGRYFSTMITRLFPDFKNLTSVNQTCSSCVLSSNLYYKIFNITEFVCSKSPRWSLKIASVNNSNIIGTLSNSSNVTIHVNASFPISTCFCLRELRNLNRTFDIVDPKNSILPGNYTMKMPLGLVLNERFQIVERAIFEDYRKMKCDN